MAIPPADPPLFYERHIFLCTNVRPEGHPRGCCSAGRSEKLRGYMREKARQMGIQNIRCNASGCLDRCELGPNMVIYPEGVWYHYENTQDIDEILETSRQERRPGDAADAAARAETSRIRDAQRTRRVGARPQASTQFLTQIEDFYDSERNHDRPDRARLSRQQLCPHRAPGADAQRRAV